MKIMVNGELVMSPIELIFFDGEEATLRDWGGTDHTYGSQYYVDSARKSGTLSSLKALVLVDMIAERSQRFIRGPGRG